MHPLATIEFGSNWLHTFGVILAITALLLTLGFYAQHHRETLLRFWHSLKAYHELPHGWRWFTYCYPIIPATAVMAAVALTNDVPTYHPGDFPASLLGPLFFNFLAIEAIWALWKTKHTGDTNFVLSITGRGLCHSLACLGYYTYWYYVAATQPELYTLYEDFNNWLLACLMLLFGALVALLGAVSLIGHLYALYARAKETRQLAHA